MKKTAKEILENAYEIIRKNQSSEHKNIDPVLIQALEEYADQFRTKWIHISTPPTKEGTYLVIWKCGGKWVDQAITFPGEDKVRFMSFDIEWWAVFPEAPERKEEGE